MDSLLKRATDSPLGKSALGVVVILQFGWIVVSDISKRSEIAAVRLDAASLREVLIAANKEERIRADERMTNLYQNMKAIAASRNTDATNIALILEYIRILPQNRGSMPMPESPKPVELKPPPTIRD